MGEVKQLSDIIAEISNYDDEGTIYTARDWSPDSDAIVAIEPDNGGLPDEVERLGFEYFLEVFILKDLMDGFVRELGDNPSKEELVNRVIYYATHDA